MDAAMKEMSRKEILKKYKKRTQFHEIWYRFTRNRMGVLGLIIILIIVIHCQF